MTRSWPKLAPEVRLIPGFFMRKPLMPPTAAALLLSTALAAPGWAQDAGFAVQVSPPVDEWVGVRIAVSAFGPAVEPAAGFVRGCAGHVGAEAAAVQIDVTDRMQLLTITSADDHIQGMVLGTPDGLFRCVLRGADGLTAAQIDNAAPGRYRAWPAGAEGGRIDTRLIVADRPVSALELRGLDIAALGAPRAGAHVFTGEGPRQTLATGATLVAEVAMAPLDPAGFCPGYSRFDAPDAILTLTEAEGLLSIFALADRDLTLAVRAPDGRILCNDDANNLNPGLLIEQAPAGDYLIFVGGFMQGSGDAYDLFANRGAPSWTGVPFDAGGPPRAGRVDLDPNLAMTGQILAQGSIVATTPVNDLPIGYECPGYIGIDAPDLVLNLAQGQDFLSVYATSETDLVLVMRDPAGLWSCNDDTFAFNPAVFAGPALPGEYLIYVGAYQPDAIGTYTLSARLGDPDWTGAPEGMMPPMTTLNSAAPPLVGTIDFGPDTRIDPRLIFDLTSSTFEARNLADTCVGFINPDAPDVVIQAAPGLPQLMVYMVSDADGVLVVVGPDGVLHCNDDFEGLNPGVMIPNPQPGAYAVFAGTYGGVGGLSTLGVTIANPAWVMDREH